MTLKELKPAMLEIETINHKAKGYVEIDRDWNGYACPWFTLGEAVEMLQAVNDEVGFIANDYRVENGRLFVRNTGDPDDEGEEVEQFTEDGKTLYALGNGSWIWGELKARKYIAVLNVEDTESGYFLGDEEIAIEAYTEEEAVKLAEKTASSMSGRRYTYDVSEVYED